MKFARLNTGFKPDITIDNFESLVWVERYQEAGDFQLVVLNEISILTKFPLGCLVSHTDTLEVMIVENHEVTRNSDRDIEITLSGRSFETFSENRLTFGSDLPLYSSVTDDSLVEMSVPDSAAYIAMLLLRARFQVGTAATEDVIPNLVLSLTLRVADGSMAQAIKRGDVYSRVLEYLRISKAGIMTIRPTGVGTNMNLNIHDGIDRSSMVIFYAQYEDLEDAKYFWSIKNYKNYTRVAAHYYTRLYRDRSLTTDLTGLARRVSYIEADDLEGTYTPAAADDVISSRAQSNLDEHRMVALLEAKISITAKPKYKIHYNIGDLVTVFGEFSVAQVMRVTEHILTVDKKEGMRGYPSLSAL